MAASLSIPEKVDESPVKPAASFPLNETDLWVLGQTDEEFHSHDWEELREIIASNNLSTLKRKPSSLRLYIQWTTAVVAKYGTVTSYILQNRLHWPPPPYFAHNPDSTNSNHPPNAVYHSPTPFADPRDFRILRNDWPYALSPGITHLVVWSKTPIATDPDTGDVTPESRSIIQDFVERTFVERLRRDDGKDGDKGLVDLEGLGKAEDRVLWFKNWTKLQSVRALEHVHVLVRGVGEGLLEEWTGEGKRVVDDVEAV